MPDGCKQAKNWSFQLDIRTRENWEKCGFVQKLTNDGQRLIYENQLRTWDKVGDAYIGQQIDIRISSAGSQEIKRQLAACM